MSFQFHGTKKSRGFPFRKWIPISCWIDPAASLRQWQPLSIKLREPGPFRKGSDGPAARHVGNCGRSGPSPLNAAQWPPGEKARSRKGWAKRDSRRALDMVPHGNCSPRALSCGAPLSPAQENWTTVPDRPRAWGGRGSRPGPPTNQIEGKKLPAFKILLLRHHPPRCAEQVVLKVRAARTAGIADGQVGWASGLWTGGSDPDLI